MWRLILPVLAIVLLGASFFRAGIEVLVLACLALLAVLAIPRPWAARTAELALWGGAGYWLARAWQIGAERAAAGEPYLRMALILGAVTVFTLVAALALRSTSLRSFYRSGTGARD